jgi:NAD-dependent dihydropyrimidine dehydrogenase PreA subunit
MAVIVDLELCDGCATCVDTCPTAAIEIVDGKARVDGENCADCGACEPECPTGALSSE